MVLFPRAGLPQWSPAWPEKNLDGTFEAQPPTLPSSSELWPPAFSAVPGSSHALGLGLGGKPESGLSSPLSAPQLITSPSQTLGKLRLPTISGLQVREERRRRGRRRCNAGGARASERARKLRKAGALQNCTSCVE